jgi:glycosyltransferase involved in cell wall biosynthesis
LPSPCVLIAQSVVIRAPFTREGRHDCISDAEKASILTLVSTPQVEVPGVAPLPRSAWRRVRLALLVERLDAVGGMERSSRRLAEELARAGARVTVVTTVASETNDLVPRVEQAAPGLTIVRFPWPTRWHYTLAELSFYVRAALYLLRHSSSWSEIQGVYAPTCGSFALLLGRVLRRPAIARLACSGAPGDMAHVAKHPARRLIAWLLERATAVACPSHEIAGEVLARAARAPVRWVPNGVDTSVFRPPGKAPAGPLVLSVVRFRPEKNVPRLLEAWALVEKARPDARLWIAGDGAELPRARDVAFHLNLRNVEFLGSRNDVPELLRQATLFVHATDAEGLPNALLEAMASGLPCVATDLAANREALGDTGSIVARDVQAIARGLLDLLNDSGKAHELGKAARARAETELGLESMVGRYARLYLGDSGAVEVNPASNQSHANK